MSNKLAWVDALLSCWGRWAIRSESGALGYASCSIITCEGDGDGYDSAIPRGVIDHDMVIVDGAIRRLKPLPQIVVVQVYQLGQGRSERSNACALGMSRQAINSYLYTAQHLISLDIRIMGSHNAPQSVIGGIAPKRNSPVMS